MTTEQERLIVENMSLVHRIVRRRYWKIAMCGIIEMEDMEQIGAMGLIEAAQCYDPGIGGFAPLAAACIRNKICNAVTTANRACRRGRINDRSLDALARPGGETPLGELIAAPGSVEDDAMRRVVIAQARAEIGADWNLILLSWEANWNNEEIGAALGVSRETARKRVNAAIARARTLLLDVI